MGTVHLTGEQAWVESHKILRLSYMSDRKDDKDRLAGQPTEQESVTQQNGEGDMNNTMPANTFQRAYEKVRKERAELSKRLV